MAALRIRHSGHFVFVCRNTTNRFYRESFYMTETVLVYISAFVFLSLFSFLDKHSSIHTLRFHSCIV